MKRKRINRGGGAEEGGEDHSSVKERHAKSGQGERERVWLKEERQVTEAKEDKR